MHDLCDFCGIKCVVNVNEGHVSDYQEFCTVSLHAGADLPRKTWQQHFQIVVILGWTVLAGLGLRQITHLSSRLSAPRVVELCGEVTQSFLFFLFNNAQCTFYMTQHTGEQVPVSVSLSKFVFHFFLIIILYLLSIFIFFISNSVFTFVTISIILLLLGSTQLFMRS